MQPKEAIKKAKDVVAEMFADDEPIHVALEEIEFDDLNKEWRVTVGFERRWNTAAGKLTVAMAAAGLAVPEIGEGKRIFKVVRIADDDGQFVSLKNYEPACS